MCIVYHEKSVKQGNLPKLVQLPYTAVRALLWLPYPVLQIKLHHKIVFFSFPQAFDCAMSSPPTSGNYMSTMSQSAMTASFYPGMDSSQLFDEESFNAPTDAQERLHVSLIMWFVNNLFVVRNVAEFRITLYGLLFYSLLIVFHCVGLVCKQFTNVNSIVIGFYDYIEALVVTHSWMITSPRIKVYYSIHIHGLGFEIIMGLFFF